MEIKTKKHIAGVVVSAVVVYFLFVPVTWLWLEPETTVVIPETWRHNVDMPVSVTVSGWHSNMAVSKVRVVFDGTPVSDAEPVYPVVLYTPETKAKWTIWNISRFTIPRSKEVEVTVPFARLAAENRVAPGTYTGSLQVDVVYVPSFGKGRRFMGKIRPRETKESIPFELVLQ